MMKRLRDLLDELQRAQNMKLLTYWYRGGSLVPTPELEIVFTDKVAVVARTRFLQYIEKHYNVQSRWVSVDKLHVQDR